MSIMFPDEILSTILGYVMFSNIPVDLSVFAGSRNIVQRSHAKDWVMAASVSCHFSILGKRAFFSTKTFTVNPKLLDKLVMLIQTATPPRGNKDQRDAFLYSRKSELAPHAHMLDRRPHDSLQRYKRFLHLTSLPVSVS